MITAEQKPIEEIRGMLGDAKKVLVLGCGTCVTVCFAGGEKEVAILGSLLRMAETIDGGDRTFTERTIKRQCDREYFAGVAEDVKNADLVISTACGIGVQGVAQWFPDKLVVPGLNTTFLGINMEQGVWSERCAACGNCVLARTGGVCPVVRCSKSLLNGPCGGSSGGKCEISPEVDCAWQLNIDRLARLGQQDSLEEITPPKDWRTSQSGGPRKIVREDLKV